MRRCTKCSMTYIDASKICRSCGAILEDVVDEPPLHVQMSGRKRDQFEPIAQQVLSDIPAPDKPGTQYCWNCSQCSEEVPGSFDVCWSCGADRNGTPGPRSFKAATDAEPEGLSPMASESVAESRTPSCTLCGSTKIVPNARIVDQGQGSGGKLKLVVLGAPEALIFKDRRFGEITADICGDCGHLALRVHNAKELYDHYLYSLDYPNG